VISDYKLTMKEPEKVNIYTQAKKLDYNNIINKVEEREINREENFNN